MCCSKSSDYSDFISHCFCLLYNTKTNIIYSVPDKHIYEWFLSSRKPLQWYKKTYYIRQYGYRLYYESHFNSNLTGLTIPRRFPFVITF